MCRLLDWRIGHFEHELALVVDGYSTHHSRRVRAWVAEHSDQTELYFLPSYAPELNPGALVHADIERSLPLHSRARD